MSGLPQKGNGVTRRTLGKYEIIERIGRGGMAEVYRGYHAALDRFVAIKLLHSFLADDPEFKDRFEKEAKNVARLRHPHIVQVFDFDYDDQGGSYYMVMELIDGPTLKDRLFELISNGQRLSVGDATRIMMETANALSYAHKRNMIHRDVKPANLMLDEDERIVLTDFGIAKIVTGAQFTASGGMVGTPAYMAPEQGLGEAGDERSDIYSLGVIYYQMLTGRLPFDADTPLAIILKHVNDPLPDPLSTTPTLPTWAVNIIRRSLEKEPHKRYQTADELLEDLKKAQQRISGNRTEPIKQRSLLAQVQEEDKANQHSTAVNRVRPILEKPRTLESKASITDSQINRVPSRTTSEIYTTGRYATGRLIKKEEPTESSGRGLLWFAILLFLGSVVALALVAMGRNGDGPLASLFEEQSPTMIVGVTLEASRTMADETLPVVIDEPSPSPESSLTPEPSPSSSPTIAVTKTSSPTKTNTATITYTPSSTRPPNTATRTPSPTRTLTPSQTPNLTQTEQVYQEATQAAVVLATASAVTPTLSTRQIVEACDRDYVVSSPLDLSIAPSLNDARHPRLARAGATFEVVITIENASNCDWPEDAGLELVFLRDTSDLGIDYTPYTRNCTLNPVFYDNNFSSPQRPRFFLQQALRRGELLELTFSGQAPSNRGCYFGLWQFEFADYDRLPIGSPLIVAIQVFGSGGS